MVDLKTFVKEHYPEWTEENFNKQPFVKSIRDEAKKEVLDDLKQTTLNKHTIRLLEKKHN